MLVVAVMRAVGAGMIRDFGWLKRLVIFFGIYREDLDTIGSEKIPLAIETNTII